MKSFVVVTFEGNTYVYDYAGFNSATWNPVTCERVMEEESFVILGKLTGTTYNEKKEEVRSKAIDLQRIDEGGLSYGEYAMIAEYFETYGKRYGLLREFRENGIC